MRKRNRDCKVYPGDRKKEILARWNIARCCPVVRLFRECVVEWRPSLRCGPPAFVEALEWILRWGGAVEEKPSGCGSAQFPTAPLVRSSSFPNLGGASLVKLFCPALDRKKREKKLRRARCWPHLGNQNSCVNNLVNAPSDCDPESLFNL